MLLHHNIATFHVMLTRARAALGWHQFTEETRAEGDKYSMSSNNISALLRAQLCIARELRQGLRLLATGGVRLALGLDRSEPEPEEIIGLAERVAPVLEKGKGVIEAAIERDRRIRAGEIDPDEFDDDDLGGCGPGGDYGSPLSTPA